MKQVKRTKTFIFKWTIILNIVLMLLMAIFLDRKAVLGIFVGGVMSLLNLQLLSSSLQRAVEFKPVKAGVYTFIQYILRYILWSVTFYIALKRPDVNLVTVLVGMLTVKGVILVVNAFNFWPQGREYNLKKVGRKEGR
ncbi:hypothetical protein JCM16358_13700 [Halanaerocella petrolearia]